VRKQKLLSKERTRHGKTDLPGTGKNPTLSEMEGGRGKNVRARSPTGGLPEE